MRIKKPQPLGQILEGLIKSLGIEGKIKEHQALILWSEVVGERVSRVTEPQCIKDGRLFVKVKSDSWRNELMFYKRSVLEKINHRVGKDIVLDIIFV